MQSKGEIMSEVQIDNNVHDMVSHNYKNTEYLLAQQMIEIDPKFAEDLQNELSMQLMLKGMAEKEQEETLDGFN